MGIIQLAKNLRVIYIATIVVVILMLVSRDLLG